MESEDMDGEQIVGSERRCRFDWEEGWTRSWMEDRRQDAIVEPGGRWRGVSA